MKKLLSVFRELDGTTITFAHITFATPARRVQQLKVCSHVIAVLLYTPGWKFFRYDSGNKSSSNPTFHKLGESVISIRSIQNDISQIVENAHESLKIEVI